MTLLEQHTGGVDQALGYTNPSTGERFTAASVLNGTKINDIKLQLKIGEGVPTGTIYWRIWNSVGTKIHDLGTSDAAAVTGSYTTIGPDSPTQYTNPLSSNDVIGAEFAGDEQNYLHQNQSSSNVYADGNWTKKPATVPEQKTTDLWFTVDYSAATTQTARLPPAPIVMRL